MSSQMLHQLDTVPVSRVTLWTSTSTRVTDTSQHAGSVFIFLPGNHSLKTSLDITAVSNISFRGTTGNDSRIIIICSDEVTVNNVTSMEIEGMTFILHLTQQEGKSLSAFAFTRSRGVVIANSVFQNENIPSPGRAILSTDSNITIVNCLFEGNTGSDHGGAIFASQDTFMTLVGNVFTRNKAGKGGAIYAERSNISLRGSSMNSNSGYTSGGALYSYECNIMITDNTFCNNFLIGSSKLLMGGTIAVEGGRMIATGSASFTNNTAGMGGAISLTHAIAEFREGNIVFKDNAAKYLGGGMYVKSSHSFITVGENLTFIGNTAEGLGLAEVCGVMCLFTTLRSIENNVSATLLNNSGTDGAAIYIEKTSGFAFSNIYAKGNFGGALGILQATAKVVGTNLFSNNTNEAKGVITITGSNVTFNGSNKFEYNYADEGAITTENSMSVVFLGYTSFRNNFGRSGAGGINSIESTVKFNRDTLFRNNIGYAGGSERGELEFRGLTRFYNNTAIIDGGGLFASRTQVYMSGTVTFSSNSACRGGAMHFKFGANLTLEWYVELSTIHNTASQYGGAICHEDSITIIQCKDVGNIIHTKKKLASTIPTSFLQTNGNITLIDLWPQMNSLNDSAGRDGNFMYGGLLDRSRLQGTLELLPYDYFTSFCHITTTQRDE